MTDIVDRLNDSLSAGYSELRKEAAAEITRLRTKIEAMERQEPVAWLHESRRDSDVVTSAVKHVWGKVAVGSLAAYSIPLYLAPGAQPALIEQDTSVRKAWARFSNELHRSPNAPIQGCLRRSSSTSRSHLLTVNGGRNLLRGQPRGKRQSVTKHKHSPHRACRNALIRAGGETCSRSQLRTVHIWPAASMRTSR